MNRRLLPLVRLAARYPLASLAASAALLAAPAGAAVWAARSCPQASPAAAPAPKAQAAGEREAADDPSLIEGRLWLDRFPEEPKEKFSLWIFLDNGIAAYRTGTGYRFQVDVVGYKRDADVLTATILEDGQKKQSRFAIKGCDDKPPFDLCLTFQSPPLGPAKLYGFKDDEQARKRLPQLAAAAASVR